MSSRKWTTEVYRVAKGVELLARSAIGYEGRRAVDETAKRLEKSYQNFVKNAAFSSKSNRSNASDATSNSSLFANVSETLERGAMLGQSAKTYAELAAKGILPGTAGKNLPFTNLNENEAKISKQDVPIATEVKPDAKPINPIDQINPFKKKNLPSFINFDAPRIMPQSRESSVPSSRIGRIAAFGNLAVTMTMGAAAESTRRIFGMGNSTTEQPMQQPSSLPPNQIDSIKLETKGREAVDIPSTNTAEPLFADSRSSFLSDANAERLVRTLCRVRGAALKLGQMLSLQDEHIVSPRLQQILERVRQSADFMPEHQVTKMLAGELGDDWRDMFAEIDLKPFAAASIGQVHRGVLKENEKAVAIKIQYPGVADSINSDIDNLVTILKMTRIAPEGLFTDDFIDVVRRELTDECDYILEAENMDRMRALFYDDHSIHVPEPFSKYTTKRVLVTELVGGRTLDQCVDLPQVERDWIGEHMLKVTLNELFRFRFMQTDPNWANFLYAMHEQTPYLILLDFGAARDYSKEFVDSYLRIIMGAIDNDRQAVLEQSRAIGFLSGFESKAMNDAHVDAVMILGEALKTYEPFDFGAQDMTKRITRIIPVMLENRLKAPPQEVYSLHRKLSGAFLLAAKLRSRVACRPIFDDIYRDYKFGPESEMNRSKQIRSEMS